MSLILPHNRRKNFSGHGASGGDSYWSDVVLLGHCEGTDGGTTFTDSSSVGRTITAVGNAHTEADQYKWGSTSCEGDGSGDKLTVADHADFHIGGGTPFTIEMWVRLDNLAATNVLFGRSTTLGGWRINDGIHYLLFTSGSTLYWQFWTSSTSPTTISASISSSSNNTWYHTAVSYDGTTQEVYWDGSRLGTPSTLGFNNPGTSGYTVAVGGSGVVSHSFNGYIDDFRITNGTGRYTGSSIAVPTESFPDS